MVSRGHEINYPVSPIGGGQIILIDIKNILIGASDYRKDGVQILILISPYFSVSY